MIKSIACALCLIAALVATPAEATLYRQNASGVCKSALPVFDGNIRSRPLALANEGTANAFVSCSMLDNWLDDVQLVSVNVRNNGASTVSASCTYISGMATDAEFFPKTRTLAAGQSTSFVWSPMIDHNNQPFDAQVNFSCSLPPGVEISLLVFDGILAPT